jgi:hypothetical protein
MNDKLEMIETYNQQGVCIKRTINGYDLPPDKEPSVQIIKNLESVTRNTFMTKEEFDHIYKHHKTNIRN